MPDGPRPSEDNKMTLASSSLPSLDDLHTKAKISRVIFPNHYISLESCRRQGGEVLITPNSYVPEPEFPGSVLRDCTSIFGCQSFSKYKPIHRDTSSPSSSRLFSSSLRWRFILCILFLAFAALSALFASSNYFCRKSPASYDSRRWYRNTSFYEIFPASFLDTDSDGYGDFQGVIKRLNYIRSLGTTAIRLNSIFSALDYPLEFENIIDLTSSDPHLGHLQDFKALINEAHDRDIKIILELNPTLTSDQHTWALHWQRGIPGYEHFYASSNRSKDPPEMENSEGPPSSDWELNQRTFGAHYVLNWSNPSVQEEYESALTFWINNGVDGFYMKHMESINVLDHKDILTIIKRWRNILDTPPYLWMSLNRSPKRILIVSSKFRDHLLEALGHRETIKILKHVDVIDHPVLVGSAKEMADQISSLRKVSSSRKGLPVPMWHLGSSDTFRIASRIDEKYHLATFYLLAMLSGSRSMFYGDEIGLKDSYDIFSGRVYRGGQLTPMQWNADNSSGGFTDNMTNPWLPVNPDHFFTNVESQSERLTHLQKLADIRRHLTGFRHHLDILDPNIIVIERSAGNQHYLLVANLGNQSASKEFPDSYVHVRPMLHTDGCKIRNRKFQIGPGSAFLATIMKVDKAPKIVLDISN